MVSSGYQGWSPWRTCICETVDRLLHCVVSPAFSFFDFDPFLFFELFNLEWAKFSQLWFCTVNNSWPSINFHASFFPSMKIHGLWQAINSHCDTLAVSKIVETKYPVFVTYQVCPRRCDLSESRRDPPPRGRGTIPSVCGVLGNLPLKHVLWLALAPGSLWIAIALGWIFDCTLWLPFWWVLRGLNSSVETGHWPSDLKFLRYRSISLLKNRYRSISFENRYRSIFLIPLRYFRCSQG